MAKKVMTEKTSVCQCCKHQYGIDKFYQRPTEDSILKTNVLPYCERCIEKIPQLYLNEGKTLQEAIWLTCAKHLNTLWGCNDVLSIILTLKLFILINNYTLLYIIVYLCHKYSEIC